MRVTTNLKLKKDGGKDHERRAKILTIIGPRPCSNRQSQHVGAKVTRVLEFSVVDLPTEHNVLLGRPTLFQLQAIPSTLHGILKFYTSDGSEMVVATKPDNRNITQRETEQETQLC
ncbi:unnamed protein product [Lactuca saligna]|uniref:Uncharacterized protein n=1 Tax=Lactuca saligna TaxID=75948 RepID=A0AA35VGN6_LACSI|nr:unnamed protein product [Lactuca saligna]